MNELILPIILGIASSLVATAIFLSLSLLMKNVVLPWYADKIYRGVRLDGHWTRTELNEIDCLSLDHPLAKLILKQKGENLTGLYTHGSNSSASEQPLESYIVVGHISNSFLTLSMQPMENDNIDATTGIWHVFNKDNKLHLRGKKLCIDSENASVIAIDKITFTKDNT